MFKKYLLSGHGKTFILLKENKEEYKDLILEVCFKNTSFDMQTEGSRAGFIYSLIKLYNDNRYFIDNIIKRFLKDEDNKDVLHMIDILDLLIENRDEYLSLLDKKYNGLYNKLIIEDKFDESVIDTLISVLVCYIKESNDRDMVISLLIKLQDLIIKNKHNVEYVVENSLFKYIDYLFVDKYGSYNKFEKIKLNNFIEIVSCNSKKVVIEQDELIKLLGMKSLDFKIFKKYEFKNINFKYLNDLLFSNKSLVFKKNLLIFFYINNNYFYGDESSLFELLNKNSSLKYEIYGLLSKYNSNQVYEFAKKELSVDNHYYLIKMILNNFGSKDNEMLINVLNNITYDYDNKSGWHYITNYICHLEDKEKISDTIWYLIYDNSLCSICRNDAYLELEKRSKLTNEMIIENKYDSYNF